MFFHYIYTNFYIKMFSATLDIFENRNAVKNKKENK